ncbi:MAG: class I SAM-dependent methyltransferase [Candidatus Rokuibacteriota bacterium]
MCRSCEHDDLRPVLSLGRTPLANALLTAEQLREPEATFPLDLVFCSRCALVQITETVPPEVLFREYAYLSSFSDTVVQNAEGIVRRLIGLEGLGSESLAVEIASNDGYLLQHYHHKGIPVLGIEPAANIARVARDERGIPTVCEFFGAELAAQLVAGGRAADVVHGNNVLAHVADLNGVVRGIATMLKPRGVAVIEVPYVKDLIDHCEFDTIYHEHLCYFSLTALDRLFRRHALVIRDVERIPIHGGSLRIFASRAEWAAPGEAVKRLLAEEAAWGVDRGEFYRGFGAKVERLRTALLELLAGLKAQGRRVAAYGASAKGSTLLNCFGIGAETLEFVVDRSTVKQGRYTPGTHLPILAPEKLLELKPDYLLLLTWNFADEILAQQQAFRDQGGRFIVPIPECRVV